MQLTSPAFKANATIPKRHTCDGHNLSPRLDWTGTPVGTESLAVIMDDPDAPPGTWVHWTIWNIPSSATTLAEGVTKTADLSDGSRQGKVYGVKEFTRTGYHGPCPPPGKPHRYFFRLCALDVILELPASATRFDLDAAMKGHILGSAELMGLYGR
jgi:Raf kinase inhibitor-like YbhB/YbcL family protein